MKLNKWEMCEIFLRERVCNYLQYGEINEYLKYLRDQA